MNEGIIAFLFWFPVMVENIDALSPIADWFGEGSSLIKSLLHSPGEGYATESTEVSPLGQRLFPKCCNADRLPDMSPEELGSVLDWVQ